MTSIKRGFKIRKPAKQATTEDVQDRQEVMNLEDLRLADPDDSAKTLQKKCNLRSQKQQQQQSQIRIKDTQLKQYDGSEDNIVCSRFPHMKFCGCASNCMFEAFETFAILPELHVSTFTSGTKTRELVENGFTHILNVTSREYTKRNKFFKYLNIDVHHNTEEDIKKFFRITNRFLENSIEEGGKVLIQAVELSMAACFGLSYLIGIKRMPLKASMDYFKKNVAAIQIDPHFLKQLESYDLEKLAFVTIKRDE